MFLNRQAGLPVPQPIVPGRQMMGLYLGRVTYVDFEKGTVDVILEDDQQVIKNAQVLCAQAGPDRDHDDLPEYRSVVALQFAGGNPLAPVVLGVIRRASLRTKRKGNKDQRQQGVYRRVFPSGTHVAVYDSGEVEIRGADGSYLAINSDGACHEDFTGQDREARNGDPFADPAPVKQTKPTFQMTLKQPDGTSVTLKDGKATITGAAEVTVSAPKVIARSGLSGIVIDSVGVTLCGIVKLQSTPLTQATVPPAGLVNLIPLPIPTPMPLL
jgi:hypothetical protein